MIKICVVIPVYNEEESIKPLINQLNNLKERLSQEILEVIIVNDGSSDNTMELIKKETINNSHFKIISLARNYGQTAAISAGIDSAVCDILITMDADLQNDPSDIPLLLKQLEEGYDVVSGWRKKRHDNFFTRVLPSKIANWIISKISGVNLHDYGCTLKAYRREVFEDVNLYGEMHRFIPIYISWQGGRVSEIPVNHHKRRFGKSKYGISRTIAVIVDLIFLKFMEKQFVNPIHLFGGFALINFGLSIISFLLMIYYKYWHDDSFIQTPLPQLIVIFVMTGMLSLFMGFIAEILMRTYFESQDKKSYRIKQ